MRRALLGLAALAAVAMTQPAAAEEQVATFAGGCFWCTEADFEKVPGVISSVSGYIGGTEANPTYEVVSRGGTGHVEAVEIRYDPAKVTYAQLLDVFWHNVDFEDAGGQFCDRGDHYRTEIFHHGDEQRRLAEGSKTALEQLGRFKPVVTKIVEAGPFYEAESYHQDYYKKNPVRYKFYRWNCGRDQRLAELWGTEMPKAEVAAKR